MPLFGVTSDEWTTRVLSNLVNETSIGLYAVAIPTNEDKIAEQGTEVAKYSMTKRLVVGEYVEADVKTAVKDRPEGTTIKINIDQDEYGSFDVEDFEVVETPLAGQHISNASASMSSAITYTLDATLIKGLMDSASAGNTITDFRLGAITKPIESTLTDMAGVSGTAKHRISIDDQIEEAVIRLWDGFNELISTIDDYIVGANENSFFCAVPFKNYARLIMSFGKYVGQSVEMKISGKLVGQNFLGLTVLRHIFIGQTIATSKINKTHSYDFSKLEAVIWHREAMGLPYQLVSTKDVRDPKTGNDGVVMKFRYGVGGIRPNLIKIFKNAV